jgi:tetratricopeptide (TPR) repeat protein
LRKIAVLAVALLLATIAGGLTVGALRYGSVEGIYRRLNAEVVARQPHPELVPTPLPVAQPEIPSLDSVPAISPASADRAETATPQPLPTSIRLRPTTPASTVQVAGPRGRSVTATVRPSSEPTPAPTDLPHVAPRVQLPPPSVKLTGISHWWQTWNNCGPATLAMNLSYYGRKSSQADVAAAIRPNKDDKNVSPDEMATFARTQGLQALARVNGHPDRLRLLLANGIPVLVETWHEPKPNDGMGHYRLLTGYDDADEMWMAYDSYDAAGVDPKKPYAGIRIPYGQFDALWKVFNRQYVVVFTEAQVPMIDQILGTDGDDQAMWKRAMSDARTAVGQMPADPFAWFNLGSDLTALGSYEEATQAYDMARQIGLPWRMLWYQFGPFQAYYQVGRHEEVVALANATLRTAKYVEELYYWRGRSQVALGSSDEARDSFLRALQMNRNYSPAVEALAALRSP